MPGLLLSQIAFAGVRHGRHCRVADMGSLGYSSRPAVQRSYDIIKTAWAATESGRHPLTV
jgi:hypothetical protein